MRLKKGVKRLSLHTIISYRIFEKNEVTFFFGIDYLVIFGLHHGP